MGQKVHPIGFRLGISHEHSAIWFASTKRYSHYLRQDIGIRKVFHEYLGKAGITDIHIIRRDSNLDVRLFITHPRIIAAFNLESLLQVFKKRNLPRLMQVYFVYITEPNAVVIADQIASQLEKRIPFRKALRKTILQIRKYPIQGLKVQISGRLNGAEMARCEWSREGRVPLHTLRVPITYCSRPAQTIYGVLGIKVWLYS